MERDDEGRGRGLSTQDLIDVEPHGEDTSREDPPREDRDPTDATDTDTTTTDTDTDARTGRHGTDTSRGEHLAAVPSEDEVADTPADEVADTPADEPVAEAPVGKARPDTTAEEPATQLFADQEVEGFRAHWQEIQIAFVDDPKRAVSEADELVAAVIQSLAATFAEHKSELESQWRQGEAPTEDLRVALRQYRSFFNQLLSS
jgi:hypothetical protein